MSSYALLIGLPHDGGDPVVISGPEVSYPKQRELMKEKFMNERVHPKFQQVQLLDSRRGVRKRTKFITPAESKRREKELKRQLAEANSTEAQEEPPAEDIPPVIPPEE